MRTLHSTASMLAVLFLLGAPAAAQQNVRVASCNIKFLDTSDDLLDPVVWLRQPDDLRQVASILARLSKTVAKTVTRWELTENAGPNVSSRKDAFLPA